MGEHESGSRRLGTRLLAIGLWACTSVLSFLEILVVRELGLRVYAHFAAGGGFYGRDYWGGLTIGIGISVVMGIVSTGVIIGGGEYHYRNFGQAKSWRLFGWTLAAELSILVLALFV